MVKKLAELSKGSRKLVVALWENGQITNCAMEADETQTCESCQGDEEAYEEWLDHLQEQGYEARKIELAELEAEESLPRFLEEREVKATPVEGE